MKTLILYATKYGAAREIAQRMAKKLNGAAVYDLKQKDMPDPAGFDYVVIGSSVYVGMIRKEAKDYMAQNADKLRGKKIGLFLSGMSVNDFDDNFYKTNFPPDILQAAKVKSLVGGIFDPKKANFFERFVMRIITKKSGYTSTISDEKIRQFTEILTKAGD
jgi:menaquinone-dependent protoporphyrinogen oxidase